MMRAMVLGLLLPLILGAPAFAHPHVFVDTALEVVFDDQGRAAGLRISWTYDDLFSLLIIEDRGLDPDFDGQLTAAELESLQGWDMQWDPGYPGDSYALMGEVPLGLSGPSEWSSSYVDARIKSVHYRAFATPVVMGEAPLVLQVYDPSYYTAYQITETPVMSGRAGCEAVVYEPDLAAVDPILLDSMSEQAGSEGVEMAFPAVGAAYAEQARITCSAAY